MKKLILTIALSFLIATPAQASILSEMRVYRLPTEEYLKHCPSDSFGYARWTTNEIYVDTGRTTEFMQRLTLLHEMCHILIRPFQEWSEEEEK